MNETLSHRGNPATMTIQSHVWLIVITQQRNRNDYKMQQQKHMPSQLWRYIDWMWSNFIDVCLCVCVMISGCYYLLLFSNGAFNWARPNEEVEKSMTLHFAFALSGSELNLCTSRLKIEYACVTWPAHSIWLIDYVDTNPMQCNWSFFNITLFR